MRWPYKKVLAALLGSWEEEERVGVGEGQGLVVDGSWREIPAWERMVLRAYSVPCFLSLHCRSRWYAFCSALAYRESKVP